MAASSLDHPHYTLSSLPRYLASSSSSSALSLSLSLPNQHLQFNKFPSPTPSPSPIPSIGNKSGDGGFLTLAPPTRSTERIAAAPSANLSFELNLQLPIEKVSGFPAGSRAPRSEKRKRAPESVPKPKKFTFRGAPQRWTEEEDEELKSIMQEVGDQQWTKIGKMMGTRTGKQCRERWNNQLHPDIKKSSVWTDEEEETIIEMHKKEGPKWAKIYKFLPGRTENSVKNHWSSTKRKVEHSGFSLESSPLQRYIGANSGANPRKLAFKGRKQPRDKSNVGPSSRADHGSIGAE